MVVVRVRPIAVSADYSAEYSAEYSFSFSVSVRSAENEESKLATTMVLAKNSS